jgi:hypothetical protein
LLCLYGHSSLSLHVQLGFILHNLTSCANNMYFDNLNIKNYICLLILKLHILL